MRVTFHKRGLEFPNHGGVLSSSTVYLVPYSVEIYKDYSDSINEVRHIQEHSKHSLQENIFN